MTVFTVTPRPSCVNGTTATIGTSSARSSSCSHGSPTWSTVSTCGVHFISKTGSAFKMRSGAAARTVALPNCCTCAGKSALDCAKEHGRPKTTGPLCCWTRRTRGQSEADARGQTVGSSTPRVAQSTLKGKGRVEEVAPAAALCESFVKKAPATESMPADAEPSQSNDALSAQRTTRHAGTAYHEPKPTVPRMRDALCERRLGAVKWKLLIESDTPCSADGRSNCALAYAALRCTNASVEGTEASASRCTNASALDRL